MFYRRLLGSLLLAASGLTVVEWSSSDSKEAGAASKYLPEQTTSVEDNPEALARGGDAMLVSSLGEKIEFTDAADTDGSVQRLLENGSPDPSFDAEGFLRDRMGLAVIGEIIAVVDIDRVVVLEKETGALRRRIKFDGLKIRRLNDITQISDRQGIVSATDTAQLFLVDIESGEITELRPDFELHHPNGLIYDPQMAVLYISGNLVNGYETEMNGIVTKAEVNLADGKVREIWSTPSSAGFWTESTSTVIAWS